MATPKLISDLASRIQKRSSDSKSRDWDTSFAVIGDFGDVKDQNADIYTGFGDPVNYVGEAVRQSSPDFVVALGDLNYVTGRQDWIDFNVGRNFSQFIYPYTKSESQKGNKIVDQIESSSHLPDVDKKIWNRFFPLPGNHDVGMTGGRAMATGSGGLRDWSYDSYFKAALELSESSGAVIPIAGNYVKPGDKIYYDYSYNPSKGRISMRPDMYDYILKPINEDGKPLKGLANIFMVDRNNAAYGSSNSGYNNWKKQSPGTSVDPQAEFLMRKADRKDDNVAWQIFASHYETFTSDEGNQTRETLNLPFFSSGYDLVIGAHVHNYERIRRADSDGIIGDYIVNGNGGYNTAYTGNETTDGIYSPVGTVDGFQAGEAGEYGFGWIDMNKDELMYRQFRVEYDRKKLPWQGLGGRLVKGTSDPRKIRLTEIDRLVLQKKESISKDQTLAPASLLSGPTLNEFADRSMPDELALRTHSSAMQLI